MRVLGTCLAIAALSSVLGCSKIDRIQEVAAFAERAERVNDQRVRVLGDPVLGIAEMPGTVYEAIPLTGTATYKGAAFLAIRNAQSRLDVRSLVGDSTVTIDFGTPEDAVTGQVSNFRQTQTNDVSEFVAGRLTLTNGVIGADLPNDLAFDLAGEVTASGDVFTLSGRADGKLRGTRTEPGPNESPVRAFSVRDGDLEIAGPAGDFTASITVIGEN